MNNFLKIIITISLLFFAESSFAHERGKIVRKSAQHGNYIQYLPSGTTRPKALLVLVHGSLNKDESSFNAAKNFLQQWIDTAERRKLLLLGPEFDQQNYGGEHGPYGGYRGMFGRNISADEFLNSVVDKYKTKYPKLTSKFYMVGHSAGGQFASRYVVMHNDRIMAAILSAPGTLAFPNPNHEWPEGMKSTKRQWRWPLATEDQLINISPDPNWWVKAATLPITIVIGSEDNVGNIKHRFQPGLTTKERAEIWVKKMNELAEKHSKLSKIKLKIVKEAGHWSKLLQSTSEAALFGNN